MQAPKARTREGTASRKRGKDRVNTVLDAATALFLRDGYSGLSLRRVAEAAGISLGNLTYYFSTKADLFESMIDYVIAGYLEAARGASVHEGKDPQENLESFLRYLFTDSGDPDSQQFFYQFWATSIHHDFVAQGRKRVYENFYDDLSRLAREANPSLDEETLEQRVILIMSLVEGLVVILGNGRELRSTSKKLEAEFMRQATCIIRRDTASPGIPMMNDTARFD